MRPSALPGRRLATAVAGLRKASELFKHSCTDALQRQMVQKAKLFCATLKSLLISPPSTLAPLH